MSQSGAGAAAKTAEAAAPVVLEDELWQAQDDVAKGDYIELTLEELDRCIAAGEWPWRDES
jgi:hypothetical protein